MSEVREFGDRSRFLMRIKARTAMEVPAAGPHPPPPPPDSVPEVRYHSLDEGRPLVEVFAEAVRHVSGEVHLEPLDSVPADVLLTIVRTHDIERAVVSAEPEAQAVGELLRAAGVQVDDYTRELAADADLGVTSASAAIAVTGTVVCDSDVVGSRAVSLLPRVHLCVVPIDRLVATPADVFRTSDFRPLPSSRNLITGPSRTGDIEQIITLGAHGPTAMVVVVLGVPD